MGDRAPKHHEMIVDLTNSDSEEEYQPEPIKFEDNIFDFAFHPKNDLVAAGLINGQVHWYEKKDSLYVHIIKVIMLSYNYLNQDNRLCWNTSTSKKSCRGVEFTDDGSRKITILTDKIENSQLMTIFCATRFICDIQRQVNTGIRCFNRPNIVQDSKSTQVRPYVFPQQQ
jgi:hypothetical protein